MATRDWEEEDVIVIPDSPESQEVQPACGIQEHRHFFVLRRGDPMQSEKAPIKVTGWTEEDFTNPPYGIVTDDLPNYNSELAYYAGRCPLDRFRVAWSPLDTDVDISDVRREPGWLAAPRAPGEIERFNAMRNTGFASPFSDAIQDMFRARIRDTQLTYGDLYQNVLFLTEVNPRVAILNGLTPGAAVDVSALTGEQPGVFSPNEAPLLANIERYMCLDDANRQSHIDYLVGVMEIVGARHPVKRIARGATVYTVVAMRDIQIGRFIGEYTGDWRLPSRRREDESEYMHGLNLYFGPPATRTAVEGYCLDARHVGNKMRFINSSGGYKRNPVHRSGSPVYPPASPNVDFIQYWYDGEPHIGVVATQTILQGTELITEYGSDYWYESFATSMRSSSKRLNELLEEQTRKDMQIERLKAEKTMLVKRKRTAETPAVSIEEFEALLRENSGALAEIGRLNKANEELAAQTSVLVERNRQHKRESEMELEQASNELRKAEYARDAAFESAKKESALKDEHKKKYDDLVEKLKQAQRDAPATQQRVRNEEVVQQLQSELDETKLERDKALAELADLSRPMREPSEELVLVNLKLTALEEATARIPKLETDLENERMRAELAESNLESGRLERKLMEETHARQLEMVSKRLEESLADNARLSSICDTAMGIPAEQVQQMIETHNTQIAGYQAEYERLRQQVNIAEEQTRNAVGQAYANLYRDVGQKLDNMQSTLLGLLADASTAGEPKLVADIGDLRIRIESALRNMPAFLKGPPLPGISSRTTGRKNAERGDNDAIREGSCVQCGKKTVHRCSCGCLQPFCSKDCAGKTWPHKK